MIFKELKLSLKIFGLLRKLVYILLNAHYTCPINGSGIGQLEAVKQYVCVSFRSSYKEYLTFDFKVTSLYSTLFEFKPLHCFVKICTSDQRPKIGFHI